MDNSGSRPPLSHFARRGGEFSAVPPRRSCSHWTRSPLSPGVDGTCDMASEVGVLTSRGRFFPTRVRNVLSSVWRGNWSLPRVRSIACNESLAPATVAR